MRLKALGERRTYVQARAVQCASVESTWQIRMRGKHAARAKYAARGKHAISTC